MPLQATSGAASYDGFGGGVAAEPNYIESVFSTYLYTGNGSTQTINNGIDLAGKGGLVWLQSRSNTYGGYISDTNQGAGKWIQPFNTNVQATDPTAITAFNTNGFTMGSQVGINGGTGQTYVSWTFRKQPKFFDVVTYTGTGTNTTIAHNLGSVPGCIIVKRTDTTGNWRVYHNSLISATYSIQLNQTNAQASAPTVWNSTAPTSAVFSVGTDATVNASGGTYVAYIFAHNAGGFGLTGTDNVISCGSFTTDATTGNATVNLGFEPQWILTKMADGLGDWTVYDNMRGMSLTNSYELFPNSSSSEVNYGSPDIFPSSTGFSISYVSGSGQYGKNKNIIYIAIRRGPMKVPTDATKVFVPLAVNNSVGTVNTTGFPVDMQIATWRTSTDSRIVVDRLRGVPSTDTSGGYGIETDLTAAEAATTVARFWNNTGFSTGGYAGVNASYWSFRRAPSFFDEVCWTATGSTVTQAHNLGVVPELVITKIRNGGSQWYVNYNFGASTAGEMYLSLTSAGGSYAYSSLAVTAQPTATQLQFASGFTAGQTMVAYLFASCPGVSKVGSYTGNGSTQTINCGFTGGARFVLIKRTDSTGDWYVWDTARGIISANDPHLSLNTTVAEVTTDDTIDPDSTGFIVNQVTATNVNVSSATYIYLAIA